MTKIFRLCVLLLLPGDFVDAGGVVDVSAEGEEVVAEAVDVA